MNQELYAFWKYDTFPYHLGGTVDKIITNGRIVAKNYPGMSFKPVMIVDKTQGMRIQAELDKLELEYREKTNILHQEYKDKVSFLMNLT